MLKLVQGPHRASAVLVIYWSFCVNACHGSLHLHAVRHEGYLQSLDACAIVKSISDGAGTGGCK